MNLRSKHRIEGRTQNWGSNIGGQIYSDVNLSVIPGSLLEPDKSMNFQVQPLKLLASRKVVREGLDYSSYLTGKTKEELDGLDKFAGKYVVKTASTKASKKGKILSKEEWDSLRQNWPICLRSFWDGEDEFSIFERIHEGKREWEILDKDGNIKKLQLTSRGTRVNGYWTNSCFIKSPDSSPNGYWCHQEDFIKDGTLIMSYRYGNSKGQVLFNETHTFYVDAQGNLVRKLSRSHPLSGTNYNTIMVASKEDVAPDRDDLIGCPPYDMLHCYLGFCKGHFCYDMIMSL